MRRNHTKGHQSSYTTEYIRFPGRPDLTRITAEPLKTVYINCNAAWWATKEHTIKSPDDPLLKKLIRA